MAMACQHGVGRLSYRCAGWYCRRAVRDPDDRLTRGRAAHGARVLLFIHGRDCGWGTAGPFRCVGDRLNCCGCIRDDRPGWGHCNFYGLGRYDLSGGHGRDYYRCSRLGHRGYQSGATGYDHEKGEPSEQGVFFTHYQNFQLQFWVAVGQLQLHKLMLDEKTRYYEQIDSTLKKSESVKKMLYLRFSHRWAKYSKIGAIGILL